MAADLKDKVWCCAKFGEILFIGEKLRRQILCENPGLIKDRWTYSLKKYQSTFVAKEILDWIVQTEQVPTRQMGIVVLQLLLHHKIIFPVSVYTTVFKDDGTLYVFTEDNGTYEFVEDLDMFIRGKLLYQTLRVRGVLRTYEDDGNVYSMCCPGSDMIDHMIDTRAAMTRDEAVSYGQKLIISEILSHVEHKHNFEDSKVLYTFVMDFSRTLTVMDLVIPPETNGYNSASHDRDIIDNCSTGDGYLETAEVLIQECGRQPIRSESGYQSDLHDSPSTPPMDLSMASSPSSDIYLGPSIPQARKRKPSVNELCNVTYEDLFGEDSAYVRKTLTVIQDDVGYGFVVRGEGPVYVKTVDPDSPSARAGLKVGHFIYSINSSLVVNWDHHAVAELVVTSDGIMSMVVMEFADDMFV